MKKISVGTCLALFFFAIFCSEQASAQKVKKVDIPKKIAEATPPELPQSPVEPRVSTDAKDEGLKGKVKSVVDYSLEAGKRSIGEENYYNSDGNLIRSISYDEGFPESVTVYGFVNGMRVSRSGDVKYKSGEKPPPKGMSITMNLNNDLPGVKRDERYDARYERKYDAENRLIELRRLGNNGKLWSLQTNTYSGNMRTWREFWEDGQEVSKSDYFSNEQGNTVKENSYGGDNDVTTHVMTYKFDAQGNWIVKMTFKEMKTKGKMVRKLLWTSYRTIIYYP